MNTKILSNSRNVLRAFVVALALIVSAGTVSALSVFDIEYPIVELGSCVDKTACKAYCELEDHKEACEVFAEKYGIGNAGERKKEREERKELVKEDGGPGDCALGADDVEKSCRAYCSVKDHMSECVVYGKEHGLMKGKELAEAEKVIKALESGVELPLGCTDGESCKEVCEEPKDIATARSCFAFAEKAGILPEGVDRERAEKVFKLFEEGKAPFKSPKDLRQCENPESDEMMEKCIAFASENGLMSPEDAEIAKKTGGKGPGGCRGKDQCELYCSEHADECMKFAEEHNLMRPEDKERMQEGITRLKESITNAPLEVKECLASSVGQEKIDKILAGEGFVGREIGETMRECFEKAFERAEGDRPEGDFPGMMRDGDKGDFRGMPPFSGTSTPRERGMFAPGDAGFGGQGRGMQFPEPVMACLKGKLDEATIQKLSEGAFRPDEKIGQVVGECFRSVSGQSSEDSFEKKDSPSRNDRRNNIQRFEEGRSNEQSEFEPKRMMEGFDPSSFKRDEGNDSFRFQQPDGNRPEMMNQFEKRDDVQDPRMMTGDRDTQVPPQEMPAREGNDFHPPESEYSAPQGGEFMRPPFEWQGMPPQGDAMMVQ